MFRDTAQGRTEGQDTSAGVGRSTAAADTTPTVFTIAGNAIGRTGKNGGNQLGIGQNVSYTLTTAGKHCVAVPEYEAYKLSGYGEYKEGVGTLRASGGDYGGGSETMIVEKRLQFAEAYQHNGYRMSNVANTQTAGANNSVRGDTSFVIENDVVRLDDFVTNEDGSCWAYMCKECAEKYEISEKYLDNGCGGGICSVQGCENEADYYIDFPENTEGLAESESVWTVATDALKGMGRRIVYRVRRMTPTECERLDGFPDKWTRQDTKGNVISDSKRYTALGNSIAVPCAERVFIGILAAEKEVQEHG